MNGAGIDGDWYRAVLEFTAATPWLHGALLAYTNLGLGLFGVLLLFGWWRARRLDPEAMAAALLSVLAVVFAYLASNLVKVDVQEPRPCRAIAHLATLEPCPDPTDYAFPSNHAVLAGAAAMALCLTWHRIGALAIILALLMGFSRVYVGMHYPHDVLAGLVLGAAVSAITVQLGLGRLTRWIAHRRTRPRWAPWLGADRATAEPHRLTR